MANPFEETLQAGKINPWQQAAESMMQVGIGNLSGSPSRPNYGNLPNKYKGFEGNTGEPIHNLLFNINKDVPNYKWIQGPMDALIPGVKFYRGQPPSYYPGKGYFPPRPRKPSDYYEGDPVDILLGMDDLRGMGEMDFLGNMNQVKTRPDLFETPGRQMEGIPQDYSHITDYYDYLNTLPVDQLQGIESIMTAARLNAARNKKWWAQSDI